MVRSTGISSKLSSETIVTKEPGYLIQVGPDQLDLLRFERLVEEGQRSSPEDAARLLREALALWRGPALADVAHESRQTLDEPCLLDAEHRLDCLMGFARCHAPRLSSSGALGKLRELSASLQLAAVAVV